MKQLLACFLLGLVPFYVHSEKTAISFEEICQTQIGTIVKARVTGLYAFKLDIATPLYAELAPEAQQDLTFKSLPIESRASSTNVAVTNEAESLVKLAYINQIYAELCLIHKGRFMAIEGIKLSDEPSSVHGTTRK